MHTSCIRCSVVYHTVTIPLLLAVTKVFYMVWERYTLPVDYSLPNRGIIYCLHCAITMEQVNSRKGMYSGFYKGCCLRAIHPPGTVSIAARYTTVISNVHVYVDTDPVIPAEY